MEVQVLLGHIPSFSMDMFPEVELLDHPVVLFLIFGGTSTVFCIVTVPMCIPTSGAQGFPLLHLLTSICYLSTFGGSLFPPMRCDAS